MGPVHARRGCNSGGGRIAMASSSSLGGTLKISTADGKPFNQPELLARVKSLLRVKEYHDTIQAQAAELAEWNRSLETRVEQREYPSEPALQNHDNSPRNRLTNDVVRSQFSSSTWRRRFPFCVSE